MSEPRKNPKTGLWEVDFRLQGKHSPRIQRGGRNGFATKDAAVAWMEDQRVDHRRGEREATPPAIVTYGLVSDRYLHDHIALHGRHYDETEGQLALIKERLGASLPVTDITEKHIVDFQKKMLLLPGARGRKEMRPSTINRYVGVIDTVLKKAVQWGYIKKNPCEYVARLEEDDVVPRFLSEGELKRLFDAAPTERCRDYMTLAYKTGIRPINLRSLKMKDVYLDKRVILIPKYKKKNSHYSVPIDDELYEWFQKKRHLGPDDLVLDFRNHLRETRFAIQKSGVNIGKTGDEIFTIYGLKHCFASHLLMKGASTFEVATLLGHSDTHMVERHYGFLTKDYLIKTASKAQLPRISASAPAVPAAVRRFSLSHEYSLN